MACSFPCAARAHRRPCQLADLPGRRAVLRARDKYRRTAPELDINDVVSCHTCLTLFCYVSRQSCGKPSPTLGILTVGSGLLIVGMAAFRAGRTKEARMTLSLNSPAFAPNGDIPKEYTCDGKDLAPPLEWSEAPAGTKSF